MVLIHILSLAVVTLVVYMLLSSGRLKQNMASKHQYDPFVDLLIHSFRTIFFASRTHLSCHGSLHNLITKRILMKKIIGLLLPRILCLTIYSVV